MLPTTYYRLILCLHEMQSRSDEPICALLDLENLLIQDNSPSIPELPGTAMHLSVSTLSPSAVTATTVASLALRVGLTHYEMKERLARHTSLLVEEARASARIFYNPRWSQSLGTLKDSEYPWSMRYSCRDLSIGGASRQPESQQ